MEKAIEIKRRAQRCIQNGDLDGALNEYEKLVGSEDSDPYNYVLLADLLFKKGDLSEAASRYLSAVTAYERASLYKNAIAVCKKMLRLTLSPPAVLKSLATLHTLDGLAGEASLYWVQYAEYMVRQNEPGDAADALRKAFDVCSDNVKVLEQLADAYELCGEPQKTAVTLQEAIGHYKKRGMVPDERRVLLRLEGMNGTPLSGTFATDSGIELSPSRGSIAPLAPPAPDTGSHTFDRDPFANASRAPMPMGTPNEPSRGYESTSLGAELAPADFDEALVDANEPGEDGVIDLDAALAADAAENDVTLVSPQAPRSTAEEWADRASRGAGGPLPPAVDAPPASDLTPAEPGLQFGANDTHVEAPVEAVHEIEAPVDEGVQRVESLLAEAQEQFRAGDRELASRTLVLAAQAYEAIGRFDSAATIYRSLSRGAQAPVNVMLLWLSNCEQRADAREAAQVACDLGDRALNDGDESSAREWFERAHALDDSNETAQRRLQRLNAPPNAGAVALATEAPVLPPPLPPAVVAVPTSVMPAATPSPPPPARPAWPDEREAPPEPGMETGRVEVAVGRGEAVTFDLGALLSEFQRGVEAQLSGDAQSHYDLGMTYREMGLLEQAIESFRVSSRDPMFAGRSAEMVGRTYIDQGRFDDAALEFSTALEHLGSGADAALDLRYHFALALEASGNPQAALREYERVAKIDGDFSDVALKVRVLRKTLESA